MLPFITSTRSNLEAAAKQADVSMEARNHFLNKLLHEHGRPGIRNQLHTLWTAWLEKTYCDEQKVPAVAASLEEEAATPPDHDDEASTTASGCGGSDSGGSGNRQFCWLTGFPLVDIAAASPTGS